MQNLPEQLAQRLQQIGIEKLNELQQTSFSLHRENDNVLLYSPTGSGKTLAYLLPALERLVESSSSAQLLIIVPARELALQIEGVVKQLQTGHKVTACYGGHSTGVERKSLSEAPAIIIGTPGRLAYHLRNDNVDVSSLSSVIIDEFDKVLEFGFLPDIEEVLRFLPKVRFRTFTSATTLDSFPESCRFTNPATADFLHEAAKISVTQWIVRAKENDKLQVLLDLVCHCGLERTLVFCNHREAVDRISELLADKDVVHDCFHGGMEQVDRERSIIKFSNGSSTLLLTTDLASRGLDIPEVMNIVHYQVPTSESVLTHRNGRTARMNASGSIYFVLPQDGWLPDYAKEGVEELTLKQDLPLPPFPEWDSVYISLGKKDKVNKIDIVGFLHKRCNLKQEDIGMITVQDFSTIVAIKSTVSKKLIRSVKDERIKKKKVKMAYAK